MESSYTTDPTEFLESAGPFLLEHPARHQLILSILGAARQQPDLYDSYQAWHVEEAGETVAAATMTPPFNLVLSDAASHWAVEPLVEAVAGTGSHVPGVVGNRPTVDRFIEEWCSRVPCEVEVEYEQGVFSCEEVGTLERPEGGSRPMMATERTIVAAWWGAFADEVGAEDLDGGQLETRIDHVLDSEREQGLWVWDLHGRPVAMSGHSPFDFGTVRIGPVYTPPEHRGRGYGTNLVADLTRYLLNMGLVRVCLYTDLSNQASNAVYERIGYRQVAESLHAEFKSSN